MSHISIVDTKITSMTMLKKALDALGMAYCVAGKPLVIKGYGKDERITDCLMEIQTGCSFGIGVREAAGKIEFVADWWAVETFSGEKQETLMQKITRRYAYETVMDKVRSLGYELVKEEENNRQEVRLTVRRWRA
jgi:hypothetical protein